MLVLLPGIKPIPPAVEAQSLNHWTATEVPIFICFYFFFSVSVSRISSELFSNSLILSLAVPNFLFDSSIEVLISIIYLIYKSFM